MTWLRRIGVATVIPVLVACGSSGPSQSASQMIQDGPGATALRIGLTEWSIQTGSVAAAPGEVELVVTNAGATVHDLVVEGEQGSWRTPLLEPGEQHTLVIETTAGETLQLDCSVRGHHSQGMYGTLPVADRERW